MKIYTLISIIFFLLIGSSSHSQTTESEGYLLIQFIQPQGFKTVINIVSPDGTSEQIELEKIPAMTFSMETIKRIITANQAKLLNVLESYRKKDYEIVSVAVEFQGQVTNYLMRKK
jgi:hypothetical protein